MGTGDGTLTVAITDAGPLIHLDELDAFQLLSEFDSVIVPKTVRDEVAMGGLPAGFESVADETVVAPDPDDVGIPEHLDAGERSAIATAITENAFLLTDDLDARDVAADRDVEVHGSVGVITVGFARGSLDYDEAVTLLSDLQSKTSLFVTDAVIERGIALLDEYD